VFDGGFTSIIDLAFGADGTLYIAELDENTWIALESEDVEIVGGTVTACDLSTSSPGCTELATGIPMLTAIVVDKAGTVWVVKSGLDPAGAEVIALLQPGR
jgi:hypothetical protein